MTSTILFSLMLLSRVVLSLSFIHAGNLFPAIPSASRRMSTSSTTRTDRDRDGILKKSHVFHQTLFAILPDKAQAEDIVNPRQLVGLGMQKFKEGKVMESIELFDRADESVPNLTPYLWQRGLSLYYADRFQEGSNQFRYDVKVNPLDVEEIVWDIACQNRLKALDPGFDVRKMALPKGKTDRRKIMGTVYSLFRGDGATEEDLAAAGHSGSPSDEFYSLFYLGLYCESIGEDMKAEQYMRAAASSDYAKGRGAADYMSSCAKIHCKLRHWT